jgi:hypothetical protein
MKPERPWPRVREAVLCALASTLVCASAHAQRLVALPEEPISGFFDVSWTSPSAIEAGIFVVVARDLGSSRPRAVRIHATAGVANEPLDALDFASCGDGRWIVTARTSASRATTYELVSPSGRVAWSRAFPPMSLPWVAVDCAGRTTLFTWVDDGELVIAEAAGDALGTERRTRIAPRGSQLIATWVASSPAELFVAMHAIVPTGATELLRIAGGAITHRRSLGRSTDVRLALTRERLVAAFLGGEATVTSFARSDLAPGAAATIPAREPGRRPAVTSLWPGANGVVVLGIQESCEGPDFVSIPQGSGPARSEPAYHTAGYLQTWTLASGQLGAVTDFGAESIGRGAWLGSTLVVVEPLRRDRNSPNEVRFYPARVHRFRLASP